MTVSAVSPSFPDRRLPLIVGMGVILWFAAAMMFRLLGPGILAPGSAGLPLVFALFIPGAWVFLWLGTTAIGIRGAAVMPALVIMSITAMLLDGLALTFFPALYGLPTDSLLIAAALLLWGVAWILLMAFVQTRRALEGTAAR